MRMVRKTLPEVKQFDDPNNAVIGLFSQQAVNTWAMVQCGSHGKNKNLYRSKMSIRKSIKNLRHLIRDI
jgi:hypothetical protein